MELLYFLEGMRTPFFDALFSLVTEMGNETVFLVLAIIIYWCVSKREGCYLINVCMIGAVLTNVFKMLFQIPRPWVLDKDFTIVEAAREAASGYSFPSGHTQTAVGLFGGLCFIAKRWWLRIVFIAAALLVAFSRMYLGVHTPLDVGVGIIIALVVLLALRLLYSKQGNRSVYIGLFIALGFAIAQLVFVYVYPFPALMDADNYESGVRFAYTALGVTAAMPLAYFIDERYIKSKLSAAWWAQIIKVVIGLAILLGIKAGLKAPLDSLLGGAYLARALRYFIMVMFAGAVWPLSFKLFNKTAKQKNGGK